MTSPPAPFPVAPSWPHCQEGADPAIDPIGCRGIHVTGHHRCLTHLAPAERAAYLTTVAPGDDMDHQGTPFTPLVLNELLSAFHDPISGKPHIGAAAFSEATFTGPAEFKGATFTGPAEFKGATFTAYAGFGRATFTAYAGFGGATFGGNARFDEATFTRDARFARVTFGGDAWFARVRFESMAQFGPVVCTGILDLSGAVFGAPVEVEAAAVSVRCRRTKWEHTAALRLRRTGGLDLAYAVFTAPIAVSAHPVPFTESFWATVPESVLVSEPGVRVTSVRGVDAAHLVLTDTDLSGCVFTGAFHLDQLRLEGRIRFADTPAGFHRHGLLPARWTRRRVLAEEHHWRALRTPFADRFAPTAREWTPGPAHPNPEITPGPDDLVPVYRHLRKACEDGKNDPDAADFYYGEMEMRRRDGKRPWAERGLLAVYWAVSGYGLRASRALFWLLLAMFVTVVALTVFGLPTNDIKPRTVGTQAAVGQPVRLVTETPDAIAAGPVRDRFTAIRARKAARIAVNSVLFRASGQNLTAVGGDIEVASRFCEPVLLSLTVLAVRSRVKR
jgi:uncharacterized protein YjbI with pentapeptide repeats